MMEKFAQDGDGGGGLHCTPNAFHSIYHHVQSCSVLSGGEGRYTHLI
jgi:hypothetical protein